MRVALSYFTRVTLIICILTSEINGAQAQQEVALESGGDELSVTTNPIDLQDAERVPKGCPKLDLDGVFGFRIRYNCCGRSCACETDGGHFGDTCIPCSRQGQDCSESKKCCSAVLFKQSSSNNRDVSYNNPRPTAKCINGRCELCFSGPSCQQEFPCCGKLQRPEADLECMRETSSSTSKNDAFKCAPLRVPALARPPKTPPSKKMEKKVCPGIGYDNQVIFCKCRDMKDKLLEKFNIGYMENSKNECKPCRLKGGKCNPGDLFCVKCCPSHNLDGTECKECLETGVEKTVNGKKSCHRSGIRCCDAAEGASCKTIQIKGKRILHSDTTTTFKCEIPKSGFSP